MMRFYETVRTAATYNAAHTCALHENFEEGHTLLVVTANRCTQSRKKNSVFRVLLIQLIRLQLEYKHRK